MRGIEVDERDSSWETNDPRYRIYVVAGAGSVVTTVDLIDATFKDAEWSATTLAGDDNLWSIALVVDDSGRGRGRDLIWLVGGDYNSPPQSPREWRMRAEMQDRLLAHRSRIPGTGRSPCDQLSSSCIRSRGCSRIRAP